MDSIQRTNIVSDKVMLCFASTSETNECKNMQMINFMYDSMFFIHNLHNIFIHIKYDIAKLHVWSLMLRDKYKFSENNRINTMI